MDSRNIVKMISAADDIIKVLRDELGEEGISLETLGIAAELGDFDKFFRLADILPTVLGRTASNKEVSLILEGGTLHV